MGKDAKFVVRLESGERQQLQALVDAGRGTKTARQRARVLLKADQADGAPDWPDQRVAEFAEVSLSTVHRVRQQFVEEGFDAALRHRPSLRRQYRKLDGAGEAKLIATACSQAPEGRCRWTLHLLADKLVELQVVDSISHECVRTTLKKTNFSRIARSSG
jgi:transposase